MQVPPRVAATPNRPQSWQGWTLQTSSAPPHHPADHQGAGQKVVSSLFYNPRTTTSLLLDSAGCLMRKLLTSLNTEEVVTNMRSTSLTSLTFWWLVPGWSAPMPLHDQEAGIITQSRGGRPTMPMLAACHYWLLTGGELLTFVWFSHFLSASVCISLGFKQSWAVMEMIGFICLAWLLPFV